MKRVFILVFLILCLFLAGARNQSLNVDYPFTEKLSLEKSVDFSSLLLKVSTDRDATCKYDTSEGISYDNMKSFDLTYGKLHERSFSDLGDGIYKYYIKCRDNSSLIGEEMELIIRVNSLVKAQIVLEEEEPLKDGRYEVTLVTSKVVSQAPSLSSSFDGTVYEPIPLIGNEKVWKGHLIIPNNFGEGVVSFKFRANDLEGREGSEIESGGAYLVDTIKPRTISSIKATGYKGEIKLEWYLDENDVREYKIYRNSFPEVKNTDFYKESGRSPFFDLGVEDGETYYYRVAGVDEANNEGELSVEVGATALLSNETSSNGLNLQLVGKVDNFIKETELTIREVENIKESVSSKQGKEKELIENLELLKEIEGAISELNLLKKDSEKYKLQDLSEEELDNKISSSRVKMEIIKKKVPESLTVLNEDSIVEDISDEKIRTAVLEIEPDISEKTKERSVKESKRIMEESELKVESRFYGLEVLYMDGTKKSVSAVERVISSKLEVIEWDGEGDFIESIPKNLAETTSDIEIKGVNYHIVKEDPVLAFGADSKKIFYYFEKEIGISSLKEIDFVFVSLAEEEQNPGITGYFVLNEGIRNYGGIILGMVIVAGLVVYFIYLKKNKGSEQFLQADYKIKEARDFLKKGEKEKAVENYCFIRKVYDGLDRKEKKKIYGKVKKLQEEIQKKK